MTMTHTSTEGLDTYVAEIETPGGNWGWRASCPQIPGCVVVHHDRAWAVWLVAVAMTSCSAEGQVEIVRPS